MDRAYKRMVRPEDYLSDEESLLAYSYDASGLEARPQLVLKPRDEEQLRRIIIHANQYRHKIVPRGAGTGMRGGTVLDGGIIIDMRHFDSIKRFDKQRGTVDVGAGVTVRELNEVLAKHGFSFPLEVGVKYATIGGLAAINQVMASSYRYGDYLELVEQVDAFDGLGRHHTLKDKDVEKVLGLEGSTGIITQLRVKVTKERARSLNILPVNSPEEVVKSVAHHVGKNVMFLEYADEYCSNLLSLDKGAHLIVGYVDAEGEMQDDAQITAFIEKRKALQSLLWKKGFLFSEEATLDEERLAGFLKYCDKKSLPSYGHIGNGILITHLRESAARQQFWADIVALGATPGGKYGYGRLKQRFVPNKIKHKVIKLKESRDYKETLNPRVIV